MIIVLSMIAKIYFYCENEKSTMTYSVILGLFLQKYEKGKLYPSLMKGHPIWH
jgi:hypothetical protein